MIIRPGSKRVRRVNINREDGMNSYKLSKMVATLRRIKGIAKAVLRALADRYPNIWPSVKSIAAEAGFSPTATRVRLRLLEGEGYISSLGDKRGGTKNTEQYVINVPLIREKLEAQRVAKVGKRELNATR